MYSVGDIKKLTGISARTLQYYDEIDLLKPSQYTEAGYRLYGDKELEKLQQIMFFKELGFQLIDIKQIMNTPDFDRISAYKKQKELLLLKKNRIDRLITLLDKLEKGEKCMSFKEFDLSEYIQALECFKETNKNAVVQYWGSVENFDDFVEKVKADEENVAKLAIQSFGSIEKYTEEMKKNLDNFSQIMESKITPEVEEIGAQREVIFQELVKDISRDYKSETVQASIRKLVLFASDNSSDETLKDMVSVMIEAYSSEYISGVTDRQYGEGTSEYVVKALKYYRKN